MAIADGKTITITVIAEPNAIAMGVINNNRKTMEIKYQTQLNANPSIRNPNTGYVKTLQQLSIDKIVALESAYNNGNVFPLALRELLCLAGLYCYVLDYGLNDSQEEMQDDVRDNLTRRGFVIKRPFFAIDVYNSGDTFLFVFLDEGVDDPMVYSVDLNVDPTDSAWMWTMSTLT